MDIYKIILNDPVYLTISILLAVAVAFSLIKKLFKFAVMIIAVIVIYIGYLNFSGEAIPKTMDELIKGIEEKTSPARDKLLKSSEEFINKTDKLLKDKSP
tara:strand:- start:6403 stop:6702 length:300 start_codon:yes stop_codon:yes gene_type:complete